MIRDAHHETHVMLDEEDGDLQLVAEASDESRELLHLLVVQSTCGLVEQHEPWLRDERARELDALLADAGWDVALLVLHGAVNRAILSRAATGERVFLGGFEQSPGCINVLDVDGGGAFVVRAVNHTPYDPAHVSAPRLTTMEQLWQEYLDSRDRNP